MRLVQDNPFVLHIVINFSYRLTRIVRPPWHNGLGWCAFVALLMPKKFFSILRIILLSIPQKSIFQVTAGIELGEEGTAEVMPDTEYGSRNNHQREGQQRNAKVGNHANLLKSFLTLET